MIPPPGSRLSAGAGAKGERLFDWAYLELADLEAAEYNESLSGLWTRGLLIRRNITDGALAFFATWCPAGTPIEVLVSCGRTALGHRGRLRDGQKRTGPRPQRDPFLARLASARLARHARLYDAGRHPPQGQHRRTPKKQPADDPQEPPLIRWSVQEIRRVATRLAQRHIEPAAVIAWSLWRRAHQAAAQEAHIKSKLQL